jgi:hypothetical protein
MADTSSLQSPLPPARRLNGWKEIAAHFRKGVRTVQRWEVELGLPVHRMGTARAETIYAFVNELEAWRQTAEANRAAWNAESAEPPGTEPAADLGANGVGVIGEGTAQSMGGTGPRTLGPVAAGTRASGRRRALVLALAGTVALGIVAGSWVLWSVLRHDRGASIAVQAGRSLAAQPASGRVEGGVLNVYDAANHYLWRGSVDLRLIDSSYSEARRLGREPVVIDDIDGDGNNEVLFVSEPGSPASHGLFCFNHDGSLRFRRQPEPTASFGTLTAAPPWRASFVKAVGSPGTPHTIWFVSLHILEFPTIVEKLDSLGHPHGQYWSDGQVDVVEEATLNGRPVVLVGGTNNEFRGGALAVLDAQNPTATAPAVNPHYQCKGCPTEAPLAFLVFPRLDVARSQGAYSSVYDVAVDSLGQIMVQVYHGTGPFVPREESNELSQSQYTLAPDFRVVKAELGRKFEVIHRVFEAKKLLDHPFSEQRDGQDLWPVLRWDSGRFLPVAGPAPPR